MAEDIRNMDSTVGKKSFEVQYQAPQCFVLDSAYCSMGRMIGYKACEESGYTYYDAVTLLERANNCGMTKEDVDRIEQKYRKRIYTREEMQKDTELVKMMEIFSNLVREVLAEGPCLIHDRTVKEFVETQGYSCISVFTTTDNEDYQVERAQTSPLYKNIENHEEVLSKIEEENYIRTNIHHYMSDTSWGSTKTYDLVLNGDQLGRDYCAKILAHVMQGN